MGDEGEDSNEGSGDGNEAYDGDDAEGVDVTDPGTETEESLGVSESTQRPADSQTPSFEGCSSTDAVVSSDQQRDPPLAGSASSRMPQSPRRPSQPLPQRPPVHPAPPPQELGTPAQFQRLPVRRPSAGRSLALASGAASSANLFDDDDRMVPSTPTQVVPHRSEPTAEAAQFGSPEDMPQTSSDLGQLASQGGLGMFESPLFLAAHEEEAGGRTVPTAPLQVAAPVFSEVLPSDGAEHVSQSVPAVSTSTSGPGVAGGGEERDDVFAEAEGDRPSTEASLEPASQGEMEEPVQPSDEASLPSTSQEPSSSSAEPSSGQPQLSRPAPRQLQRWTESRGRMKRGQTMFLGRGSFHGRRFAR